MTVTRTSIHKALKASGKSYVCELDDGSRMVTNTHVAWKPGIVTGEEFAHYNVDLTPGAFEASATLTRLDVDPPNMQQIVTGAGGQAATRHEVGGKPAFVELHGGKEAAVFDLHDGTNLYVAREYLAIVEAECNPNRYECAGALKPLACYRGDEIVAVIMGIRSY